MMIYTNHLHMKSEKGKKKWEKKRERGREMKSIYTYECTAFHGFRFITAPREHSKSSYFSKSYSSHLSCRTHSRLFVPSIDPVLSKPFMCMSIVEAFLFFFGGGRINDSPPLITSTSTSTSSNIDQCIHKWISSLSS